MSVLDDENIIMEKVLESEITPILRKFMASVEFMEFVRGLVMPQMAQEITHLRYNLDEARSENVDLRLKIQTLEQKLDHLDLWTEMTKNDDGLVTDVKVYKTICIN